MDQVAERVREFLYEEKVVPLQGLDVYMRLRICGYSAGRSLAEVWEVLINGRNCAPPALIQPEDQFGPRWNGEYGPMNRLLLGLGNGGTAAIASALGIAEAQVDAAYLKIIEPLPYQNSSKRR